jgi:hypothetical protein
MAKTALFYDRKCPNLNCISIMMSFLTHITGFIMNFELIPFLTTALTDTIGKGDHLRIISAEFG